MLVILLVCSGEFSIFSNYISNNCVSSEEIATTLTSTNTTSSVFCILDSITMFSLVNKANNDLLDNYQHYFNFIALIAMMFFMLFLRKSQKELFLKCDFRVISPAQYTIEVKNIPKHLNLDHLDFDYKKALREYFEENFPDFPFLQSEEPDKTVTNINLCYMLTERTKVQEELKTKLQRKALLFTKTVNKQELDQNEIEEKRNLDSEIERLNNELSDYEINSHEKRGTFCGVAFVSFNSHKRKEHVVKLANLDLRKKIRYFISKGGDLDFKEIPPFYGQLLSIKPAPEPNEIIFNNLSVDKWYKIKVRIFTWFLTLCEVAVFGGLIYYLLSLKFDYYESNLNLINLENSTTATESLQSLIIEIEIYSCGISFLISVINNFLIVWLIKTLVKYERHSTYTREKINLAVRYTLVKKIKKKIHLKIKKK